MVIELFGLPGAGKTTLAQALKEKGYIIIKVENNFELIFYNILFILLHPYNSFVIFSYIFQSSEDWKRFYPKFTNAFLQCNARYQKSKFFKKALVDQGFFQNIITIFEKKINKDKMGRFLRSLPRLDLLIVVEADEDLRKLRLASRGYRHSKSFFEKYNTPAKVQEWEETINYNYQLFKGMIDLVKIKYQIIHNDYLADKFKEKLTNF